MKLQRRKTKNLPAVIERDAKGHFIKGNKEGGIVQELKPPANAAETVLELTSRGVSEIKIAKALGVSVSTWQKWRDSYPEIQEAHEIGRANEHDSLFNVLFESATKSKNLTACMFLLKTRHGYKEGEPLVIENRLNITYELPGALSEKQYEENILKGIVPKTEFKKLTR